MARPRTAPAIALVAALIAPLSRAQPAGDPARATDPAPASDLGDLRARWAGAVDQLGITGMAVVVVKDDRVVLRETFGSADPALTRPITPDSGFYIASATKSFLATGVMMLVDEGKIDLDAPVKRYLPRFQVADADLTERLTVGDLLSHAKGLDSGVITFGEAYTGEMNEDRFYRLLRAAEAAGTYKYSNLHFTIAGRIIEAVSGLPWRDFLAQRLFAPAGMTRATGYASALYAQPDAAFPIIREADGHLELSPVMKTDRTMHAAGGLGMSINDLALWLRLQLGGGSLDGKRLVSEESVRRMHALHSAGAEGGSPVPGYAREGYGLGWFVGAYHGHRFVQHTGGYIGARANVTLMPAERLGIAVVTNIGDAGGPLTELVAIDVYERLLGLPRNAMLPQLVERETQGRQRRSRDAAARPSAPPASGAGLSMPAEAYAGAYENEDYGTLRIEATGGVLSLRLGDLGARLGSTGTNRFDCDFPRVARMTARFEPDGPAAALILHDGTSPIRFTRR